MGVRLLDARIGIKPAFMSSLAEALADPAKKPAVVADCLTMIDEEVASKSGISGMAIKAGYKTVKGVKPGFVKSVVQALLPEFAAGLDPIHAEAVEKGVAVSAYFESHKGRVADALLAVTDAKAEHAENRVVKAAYDKLRGMAKKQVEAAVPRLAGIVQKYAA